MPFHRPILVLPNWWHPPKGRDVRFVTYKSRAGGTG